jgi:hypothetical protein
MKLISHKIEVDPETFLPYQDIELRLSLEEIQDILFIRKK